MAVNNNNEEERTMEEIGTMDQAVKAMVHRGEKYLTFSLAEEEYGIGIASCKV
jgi:hypothetical protein